MTTLKHFSSLTKHTLRASISNALSNASNPKTLRKIHALLIVFGLARSVFFSGKLISKYDKLKDPISAISVFHQAQPITNVYQWNSIIRALTHNGLFAKAIEFYDKMKKLGLKADTYTFPSVINACAGLMDFEKGNEVYKHVFDMGFGSDLYICNALIDMYSRFGTLEVARKVFDEMPVRDVVSWNSLVSGYSSNGYWEEALEVYWRMRMDGIIPDCFTVSSVLPACGGLGCVEDGELLHGLVEKMGMNWDVIVNNGLISMYFKFDRLIDAKRVFNEMLIRDSVSWNTVICGYCQLGLYNTSIKLFREMINKFEPDLLTITSVLRACGFLQDLELGKFVHDYMISSGFECDTTASNILIDMYAKCGNLVASRNVFDRMERRDLVSWNTLISAYIHRGLYDEALGLFQMMKTDVKPDSITYAMLLSISGQLVDIDLGKRIQCDLVKLGIEAELIVGNACIDMYAKCGKLKESIEIFDNMKVHDIVTYNTIVAACLYSKDYNRGLQIINQMRYEGVVPDVATFLGILPMCSLLAAKKQGKQIHGIVLKLGYESEVPTGNALIEMYSKSGLLKYSVLVFEQMKNKDVITWTSLITAYGMYGEVDKALKAFNELETSGILPDHIAFVAVIFACSHSALVDEGLAYFDRMKNYNIEPRIEHYACVVDLLSRSGRLAEAEKFIYSMPIKPDASIWGALLSACRARRNTEIAERASERIMELNSDDPGYYVLVSNVYAALGKWDQVKMVRKFIEAKGLKKDPGRSWIEINNRVYVFGIGDRSFEQFEEVKKLLGRLADLMAKEGYVADLQYVLHDVGDDEKIDMLCGHSERLAIAFGLLNTKPGTPLQIMKNLRVCGDCHTWTKYISKIVQSEILVRDANRFHIFKDGTCSCGDQW